MSVSLCPDTAGYCQPELVEIFEKLVFHAAKYKHITGRFLPIFGELGEIFG